MRRVRVRYVGPPLARNFDVAQELGITAVMEPGRVYSVSKGLAARLTVTSVWEPAKAPKPKP
jgi:hypothetical protein